MTAHIALPQAPYHLEVTLTGYLDQSVDSMDPGASCPPEAQPRLFATSDASVSFQLSSPPYPLTTPCDWFQTAGMGSVPNDPGAHSINCTYAADFESGAPSQLELTLRAGANTWDYEIGRWVVPEYPELPRCEFVGYDVMTGSNTSSANLTVKITR